jgi:predicted permease
VGVFSVIASLMETRLPVPEGDRVVALRNAITTEPGRSSASLRDYLTWRDELRSVQALSAFTTIARTLVVPGGDVDLVRVARMTASGFRLTRTAPLLGRTLLDEDERSDARVVVIGHEEWRQRFAADPGIIGRSIDLGTEAYTVVGVMPEGFRFPVDDGYWIPLVIGAAERARADAVAVTIAGRLTEGATLARAQAELDVIGTRMTAAYPDTHEHLRPRVVSYTRAFFDMDSPAMVWTGHLYRFFMSLLLVLVAVNVAILVYARTATRIGEIAVRTALGASRARVVTQLFAEALVLSAAAAAVGLTIAGITLGKLQELAEFRMGMMPFWVSLGLSPGVITYALVLAIAGGVIVGVVPALKATGHRVHSRLQRLSERGTGLELGRAWTALIVAQIAVAVAGLPFAMHLTEEVIADAAADPGYAVEEFLEASLAMERAETLPVTDSAGQHAREQQFRTRAGELIDRLGSDPAVAGVTFRIPARYERMELEDLASSAAGTRAIALGTERIDVVDAGFFALYDMPIVAGRTFVEADASAGTTAVVVNQVFADKHLGNSVLGRRVRIVHEAGSAGRVESEPWGEIVGVVRDFQESRYEPLDRIYMPIDVAHMSAPIGLAIRTRAGPAVRFAPRLRRVAAAVDPGLQLDELVSAAEQRRQGLSFLRYLAIGTATVMLSVLLLSAAGIYAMMSFTVARRRREIGIRCALGADPRHVLSSVFARAGAHVASGILLGLIGTIALDRLTGRGPLNDGNAIVLAVVAALMTIVGLMAAMGPARRGLAVQPSEALRED